MRIHLLDPGSRMYGDAVLVEVDGKTILVDGAHPGDDKAGRPTAPLQEQMSVVLGKALPLTIDLLVVTHCHSDHIGCLPELISNGLIVPRHALVADEMLGFGRQAQDDAGLDLSPDALVHRVVAALREEPRGGFRTDAELEEFIQDAATLESRYVGMLAQLEELGVPMVRYGRDDPKSLLRKVGIKSLKILGPKEEQLFLCAEAIRRFTKDAVEAVTGARARDSKLSDIDLYRLLAGKTSSPDLMDAPGKGAALNDQSILLTVGDGRNKCLLTGDMQFAAAETTKVPPLMEELRAVVKEGGPYAFVKLPHHGSYNGVDEDVLVDWGTKALGITTGSGDPGHPSSSVLKLLKQVAGEFTWARTDKNGRITVSIDQGQVNFEVSRGELNDFSANSRDEAAARVRPEPVLGSPPVATAVARGGPSTSTPAQSRTVMERREEVTGVVEVTAKIPNRRTRVTITVDIEPEGESGSTRRIPTTISSVQRNIKETDSLVLAAGRPLPRLLFVTEERRLGSRVGDETVAKIRALIERAGQDWLDVAGAANPRQAVHDRAGQSGCEGVVLLGGYDVIPAERADALPPEIRAEFAGSVPDDPDGFIVWSDEGYADTDGDGAPELPVSRIPDGGSASLIMRALTGSLRQPGKQRFGLRNSQRPFADAVFRSIPGLEVMLASEPTERGRYALGSLDAPALYFMLHGSNEDGTTFWGERRGDMLPAVSTSDFPDIDGATVFAGCCWGALTVNELASEAQDVPTPKSVDQSIALTCLAQGARAFVGCTGVHYSPYGEKECFGSPMHHEFWRQIGGGQAPAAALYLAKLSYIRGMFHGVTSLSDKAVEYKILRQFTCLGLGW